MAVEFCLICGAVRAWAIPGYKNSGWRLKGEPMPYCDGIKSNPELLSRR